AMAGWFKETGWFSDVRSASIPGIDDPLHHLLSINSLPLGYVCLLINANILNGSSVFNIPNHWVVLGDGAGKGGGSNGNDGSIIRIGTPGAKTLDSRGRAVMTATKRETHFQHEITYRPACVPADSPNCLFNRLDPKASRRAELEKGTLDFKVYSWARIRGLPAGLTVEKFLSAYFGYVAATVK
ncbi:MAG: hypothetical protein LBF61_08615, partial [Azoarcus sp.]|nr:hypothetical protein [Azoarcus sp.]